MVIFLGFFVPALLVPLYSWATVGTPFDLPYRHQALMYWMKEGFMSIKWPSLDLLYFLLLGRERGLFFWSPVLLLSLVGYFRMARDQSRPVLWTLLPVLLAIVVLSGRRHDWQAGWCYGARYLAPILPLMALPCAYGLDRIPQVGHLLGWVSVGLTAGVTLTDACIPTAINPINRHLLTKLYLGQFSYNLLSEGFGLPRWIGVVAFFVLLIFGYRIFSHALKTEK